MHGIERGIDAQHLGEALEGRRCHPVIRVEEVQPFVDTVPDAGIARGAQPPVLLPHQADAPIARGISLDNHAGLVGRAVIHDDCLPVRERLGTQGVQCRRESFGGIPRRNDDGNPHWWILHFGLRHVRRFRQRSGPRRQAMADRTTCR